MEIEAMVAVVVGLALLFAGRQLFWIFVGGAGFVAGIALARELTISDTDWVIITVALVAGILGAVLSIFIQRIAIAIAGFIAGGYILFSLASHMGTGNFAWIIFIVGGILGAFLVMVLFDWALILLSSLTGALLISQSIRIDPALALAVLVIAFIAGVAVQAGQLRRKTSVKHEHAVANPTEPA